MGNFLWEFESGEVGEGVAKKWTGWSQSSGIRPGRQ